MRRVVGIVAGVAVAGAACGGWLSPSQPGFTPDEALCRIAGDQSNAVALVGATNGLWQAMGSHNHDARYDAAGAANAVCNTVLGVVAGESGARAAFDAGLQAPNELALFGRDLYRETAVDGPVGWLDWRVREIVGQGSVNTWAHWENVILNGDLSVDEDQVPDFGGSEIGPYAWILDGAGNYRVPQEWQEGDHFANVGPDNAVACWWDGWQWQAGQTMVGETEIWAVESGYGGSDLFGVYDEYGEMPVSWRVGEDEMSAYYTVEWEASANAPQWAPWFVEGGSLEADIRVRPAAALALVSDGGVYGQVYAPDGTPLAWLGNGAIEPPVEMQDGAYFEYGFLEGMAYVGAEMSVWLGYDWLYGFERTLPWLPVPSAHEVTNIVGAAIAGDTTRYLKGEVDELVAGVRGDLAVTAGVLAASVAASTNLLAPALAGQFGCAVARADSNGVAVLAWSNSPFLTVANTGACFVAVPAMPATGQAASVYFDCLGTNAMVFTRPVLWASAPPAGGGLYQLYGNGLVTNVWRGWAVPETRAPAAWTQFVYGLPPTGPISNGLFARPVSVMLGNGATTGGLPESVAVLVKEQTWAGWQALPLARTNLYGGDVYLPLGTLQVAWSNAADGAVSAMPAATVQSAYRADASQLPGLDLDNAAHWNERFATVYPRAASAWYAAGGTLPDGTYQTTEGNADIRNYAFGGYRVPPDRPGCVSFLAVVWGGGTVSPAWRSPAITGKISRVRLYAANADSGASVTTNRIDYCANFANWTAASNWVTVWSQVLPYAFTWYEIPINRTNGYLRLTSNFVGNNRGYFYVSYFGIE